MPSSSIVEHHPCWSNSRGNLWQRIHLPVADRCNIKCIFCEQNFGCCGAGRPGAAAQIMKPSEAITRLKLELSRRKNLRIIAVSGPGDPLASKNAMETLHRIRQLHQDAKICLSTNGTLLEENMPALREIEPSTISVSIHAAKPLTASRIYEWIEMDGRVAVDKKLGSYILNKQLIGIRKASAAGILVKVNTVLIPQINENEMVRIAKRISEHGATLHNVIPLIPSGRLKSLLPPTKKQLNDIRKKASQHIPQFYHCYQCRSDVVGIPGQDDIL